ncbi:MAG: metal ABC transporter ATP-binding protein [Phycisphaerales bacterium]|nr:metal ABC transporter ATP-binding protein [Phycisphaerales bacterium]
MTDVAAEIRDLSFTYPGAAAPALEGISLTVRNGELLAVVGPNGGGKSTLVRLLVGLLPVQRGEVRVLGRSPRDAARAGLIGYVPQRSEAELNFPVSARQVVEMAAGIGLPPWRGLPGERRRRVGEALARVGAGEFAERPVGELSGGQFQRVLVARALAVGARLLVLDEPTVGIDVAGQRRFTELIQGLRRELGLTIVLVSHDLRTIAAGAFGGVGEVSAGDRVACLRRTVHFHAAPAGVTPRLLAEVFQHDLADLFGPTHVDAHPEAECAAHGHAPHAHPHGHAHGRDSAGGGG